MVIEVPSWESIEFRTVFARIVRMLWEDSTWARSL